MLFNVLSIVASLMTTFFFTHSYFMSYYHPSSPLLYLLCATGVVISLLYTLPSANTGRKAVKVLFVLVPFFTLCNLVYNHLVCLAVIILCAAVAFIAPKKTYYKRILFTQDNTPFTVTYVRKKTFRQLWYRGTCYLIVPMVLLLIATGIFTTPSRLWLIRAFPIDITKKDVIDSPAIPSGNVSSTIWYDTNALLVVDLFDIATSDGMVQSPCEAAGLLQGDIITKINGESAYSSSFITSGGTQTLELEVMRVSPDGKTEDITVNVTPVYDEIEERYLIGMSFYTSAVVATSVQTVSFLYPNGYCVATAHDSDEIYSEPENLTGILAATKPLGRDEEGLSVSPTTPLGTIDSFNIYGAYGVYLDETIPENITPLPIARKHEVRIGNAKLLSDFEGNGVIQYDIYITGTYRIDSRDVICFIVVDENLRASGGITRGMSGSPIIQNGKIIGALSNMDAGGYSAYATFAYDMAHEIYLRQDNLDLAAKGGTQ